MSDKDRIRELIRYEFDPSYFEDTEGEESVFDNDPFTESYTVTYDDIVTACKNLIEADVDYGGLEDWVYYTQEVISEHCIIPKNPDGYIAASWGTTDEDMIELICNLLHSAAYDELIFEDASLEDCIEQIYQIVEDHEYNRGRDISEWRISKLHREHLFWAWDERTEKMTDSQKSRYRELVDQACEEKHVGALRLKGYICYGGGDLYECDWEESRRLITELYEITENPQYANTLGYIYYYGRCNNGVPEYDKAFQYYSIGAANDLLESMYKLADMFKGGKGCIKSPRTSAYIIKKLYKDVRPRFCHGSDANFADIALRRAAIYQENEQYQEAYACYLEADYAIKERLKKSDFFGNIKVQENITKSLNEVREQLPKEFFVDRSTLVYPYFLRDLFNIGKQVKVDIQEVEVNRYKMRFSVVEASEYDKVLVVYPELDYVIRTDTLEYEVITEKPIVYYENSNDEIILDAFITPELGEFFFCRDNEDVFFLAGAQFIAGK